MLPARSVVGVAKEKLPWLATTRTMSYKVLVAGRKPCQRCQPGFRSTDKLQLRQRGETDHGSEQTWTEHV